MSTPKKPRRRRAIVVAAKRPRCPACNSTKLATVRTLSRDGDLVSQRKRCRTCGEVFILISD